jgi:hypothetical protein
VIDVVIAIGLPFCALVETGSGMQGPGVGLVRGDVAVTLQVKVVNVEEAELRFSARLG